MGSDKGRKLCRQAAEPIAPNIAINGVSGPHQAAGVSEGPGPTNRGPAFSGALVCDQLKHGGGLRWGGRDQARARRTR